MAKLLQITCLILLLSMVHGWSFPSILDEDFPSIKFHGSFDDSPMTPVAFKDLGKMMTGMKQNFKDFLDFPPSPTGDDDDSNDDRKKLDAVEPVCTTKTNPSSSTTFMRQIGRKKFRRTQTTTCIKELIIGGKTQMYKEINVTDTKGILISQSKSYHMVSIDTSNDSIQ